MTNEETEPGAAAPAALPEHQHNAPGDSRRGLTVGTWLRLVVAAAAVPALAIAAVAGWSAVRAEQERLQTYVDEVRDAAFRVVVRDWLNAVEDARLISRFPALREGDLAAFHAYASELVNGHLAASAIALIGRDGQLMLATTHPFGTSLPRTGFSGIDRAFATAAPTLSDLYTGAMTRAPLYATIHPLEYPVAGTDAALAIGFYADSLTKKLSSLPLPEGWLVVVVDGTGTIVARSLNAGEYVGQPAVRELQTALLTGESGRYEAVVKEGTPMVASFRKSTQTGWAVAVGAPREQLLAPLHRSIIQWALVAAGIVAGGGVTAWLLGRRLGSVSRALSVAATRVGAGAPHKPLSTGVRELDQVSRGLHEAEKLLAAREEKQALLVGELQHRINNILAVVQALARQTFAGSDAQPEVQEAYSQRISALAHTHELLTETAWGPVLLAEAVIRTVHGTCGQGARLHVEGPRVELQPKQAVALSMALHELCTNALKYGAFSTPGGEVHVRWEKGSDVPHWLTLVWMEKGGPPVKPPERRGFGSVMVEQVLAQDIGGEVSMDFQPDGLVCTIKGRVE